MGTNGGIGMVDIKDLDRMSDEGLDLIQKILLSETKEDVILEIERIKKEREAKKGKTMNDLFLVDQLNIDISKAEDELKKEEKTKTAKKNNAPKTAMSF